MSIEDRLIDVMNLKLDEQKPYAHLQFVSKISAERWRNVAQKKQRATSDMIEWACQAWPELAYWLVTGNDGNNVKHSTVQKETNLLFKLENICQKEPKDWTKKEFDFVSSITFNAFEQKFKNPNAVLRSTFIWHNSYKNKKLIEETIDEFNKKMNEEEWKTIEEGIEGLAEMGFNVEKYGF